jgi:hypothetical protein
MNASEVLLLLCSTLGCRLFLEFKELALCVFAHHVDAARDAGSDDQRAPVSVGETLNGGYHCGKWVVYSGKREIEGGEEKE